MALQISPEIQARIADMVERGPYADADSLLAEALELLSERVRYQELKRALALGVKEVAEGRIVEFTPELRERLWQQAIGTAESGSGQRVNGRELSVASL